MSTIITSQDKELLLKDLCGRLPYKVICHFEYEDYDKEFGFSMKEGDGELLRLGLENSDTVLGDKYLPIEIDWWESEVRPYLRPMSSMTEEEKKIYNSYFPQLPRDLLTPSMALNMFDWLNANHFDYRGLIEKGLALEAPKEWYNF